MKLTKIVLENFRNYDKIEVSVSADLVLILGENASGKTNFLESIYFLSRLKSFRAPDNILVNSSQGFFNIKAELFNADKSASYEIVVQTNPILKRQYKIDGQKTKRGVWKSFTVVLFVPNDLNLFSLGPILRRKFLDETLTQVDQQYALDLESLDHVLKQKAALLEQIFENRSLVSELEFWNVQLAPIAMRITNKRTEFVGFLNQNITSKIKELTGFENRFEIEYKRIFSKNEEELLVSLKEHESAEIRSGKNLIGPHRDDFEIKKDGQVNLFNSSGGELRSQILALKLLQADYLVNKGKKPIILLDDVFSELDEIRRIKLLESLSGHQIFITSTETSSLPQIKQAQVLKVERNQINQV